VWILSFWSMRISVMKLFLKIFGIFFVICVLAVVGTAAYFWNLWSSNLPYIGTLKDYQPPVITEIYSADGEIIGSLWEERRIVKPLEQFPEHLIQAFIAAEDGRFFEHEGVDVKGIIRAFIKNLKAGRIEQGGSTITQQVTKSLLLQDTERTYRRKFREALMSLQLEKEFTKEQILFLYLNQIYLGQGAYGVESAARTYFGKGSSDLTLTESAILAGLPQAPARYSPVTQFARAKSRQAYVLERMKSEGFIDEVQQAEALAEPVVIQRGEENPFFKSPYFSEHVRRYLVDKYGRDKVYREGLKVYTTLDLSAQRAAQAALIVGLEALDRREGYRGPLERIEKEGRDEFFTRWEGEHTGFRPEEGAVAKALVERVDDSEGVVEVSLGSWKGLIPVDAMSWARKPNPDVNALYVKKITKPSVVLTEGDVVLVRVTGNRSGNSKLSLELYQEPLAQGAILCLDQETCEIRAMVGGRDFSQTQFNRVVQSRRQPGSAFKPIIYAAALDRGLTATEQILDTAAPKEGEGDRVWKPKNYERTFYGKTLLRTGIIHSRNVITIKLLEKVGVNFVIDYARMMGIEASLDRDLSLALGSSGLSLLELTRAYSVFAKNGMLGTPLFITRVEDRTGDLLEEHRPSFIEAIPPQTAYVMTDLLKAVIQEGTGRSVREIGRPAAGKTGTTNDMKDAWFMGYTPE
ncbi:MAG TPA: PBP1A family penicillin-binding protein, partial [Desulfobacteraceae bacterium]|nr:PBP1A family penicillin-binding protein [Desulfobacteraceae bacterium]